MPEEPEEVEGEEGEGSAAEGAEEPETSLDEIIAKKAAEPAPEEEAEEESVLETGRGDERAEPLAVKVVPQQPTEFVCKSCYLVKHRSQLADKRKMFCRDCVKKRS
ncbi:MAG: DUF4193 family protein [Actinomycetota bacterium]